MFERITKEIERMENTGLTESEQTYLKDIDKEIADVWHRVEVLRKAAEDGKKRSGFFRTEEEREATDNYKKAVLVAEAETERLRAMKRTYTDNFRSAEKAVETAKKAYEDCTAELENVRKTSPETFKAVQKKEALIFSLEKEQDVLEKAYNEAQKALRNTERPIQVETREVRDSLYKEAKEALAQKLDETTEICHEALKLLDRIADIATLDEITASGRKPVQIPYTPSLYRIVAELGEVAKMIDNL